MTIETKYNIGDEVWIKGNYGKGIVKGEIQDLRATSVFLDPSATIEYTIRSVMQNGKLKLFHRLEEDVFPTKEELLNLIRKLK